MKKTKGMLLIWALILSLNTVFAEGITQPKFSLIPIVKAPPLIAANGVALAQYLVTNNTFVPRMLTLTPIEGIVPTPIPGGCTYPFFLAHGQSCLLGTFVAGSLMPPSGVHSGPVVCKTMGVGDNRADPFLCSQAAPGSGFNVSKTGFVIPVTITASITTLTFSTVIGGAVTVTNTATNASADNIGGIVPPGTTFTTTTNCPRVLLPQASCQVFFNSNVPGGPVTATIQGSNTNPINVSIEAVAPTITVTPTSETFTVGNGFTLAVENTSAIAEALNVTAIIPPGSPLFIAANACPSILPPMTTCHIAINSLVPTGPTNILIQGVNSNAVTVSLTAELAQIDATQPPAFLVNTTTSTTVTLTSAGPALNVSAHIPPGSAITVVSSNCAPSLTAPPCTITFTSPTPETTQVLIYGTNTNVIPITVQAQIGTITVTPPTLGLTSGVPSSVTVTNTSPYTLHNIAAYPPVGSSITANSSGCAAPLIAGDTCQIQFQTNAAINTPVVVPIFGSDTNQVSVSITSAPASICFLPGCTSSINVGASNPTVQVFNNSTANAVEVGAITPPDVTSISNCPASLPPLGDCTISFDGDIFDHPVNIPINGLNTVTIVAKLSPYLIELLPNSNPLTLHVGVPSSTYTVQLAPGSVPSRITSISFSESPLYNIENKSFGCGSITLIQSCSFTIVGTLPGVDNLNIVGTDFSSGTVVTNLLTLPLTIVSPWQAILSVSPTAGTINLDDPTQSTIFTVTNESSSTVSVSQIKAKLPKDWKNVTPTIAEDCNELAPGASCKISFAATSAYVATGKIEISSEDAEPVKIALGFIKEGGLVFDINDEQTKVVSLDDLKPTLESENQDSADLAEINAQTCKNYRGAGFNDWTAADIKDLIKIEKTLTLLSLAPEMNHLNCMRTLE